MFMINKFIANFLLVTLIFINQLSAKENSAAIFLYHRFEENKYPSTNIRISQFKQHIEELKKK